MKEVNEIYLGRMNNGAHFQYMTAILTRAKADETISTDTHLVSLLADFEKAVNNENANLVLSQKSLYTDDITASDSLRDSLYSAYKRGVKSYVDLPDTELAEAAKVLWQHIKDYGIDPKMQLDKETGLLTNFITDLKEKYAEQVTILSLTILVEKLNTANTQVIDFTAKRTEERMATEVGALKTARSVSDDAYRAFVKMVNALALVFGEADYANFIDYVNTEIVHYKREVLGQKATASTGGSSSEESTEEEEKPSDMPEEL